MKKDLLEMCVYLSLSLFSVQTYAEDADCDCYMEYRNLEAEAMVYANEESKEATLTEFSLQEKLDIQEATTLLADG